MYKIEFTEVADEDKEAWKKSGQKILMNRITRLLKDIEEHPKTGIGKPEALKYDLAGNYSRKINDEHRIVYSIDEERLAVTVHSLRGHYLPR